jgi:hypothetical protein
MHGPKSPTGLFSFARLEVLIAVSESATLVILYGLEAHLSSVNASVWICYRIVCTLAQAKSSVPRERDRFILHMRQQVALV